MLKQLLTITTLGAIATVIGSPAAEAAPRDFVGTWVNTDTATGGITRLVIRRQSNNRLNIQVFGQCQPRDCDWGRERLLTYGTSVQDRDHQAATAIYNQRFATTVLTLDLRNRTQDRLRLRSFKQFTDRSNRQDYTSRGLFRRVRRASLREDCVGFNPDTTRVRRINNRWKIVDGNHWMFDFGTHRQEARDSLRVIQHYAANQSCFVGRPEPSFKYLLTSATSPIGAMPGEDCVNFNPRTTAVRRHNGRWKIVDGDHLMFDFGANRAEARQSLAVIRKHGFNKSCFVGRPGPSFSYLRR